MSLHVGLNLVFLGERAGGVGRYLRGLLSGISQLEERPRLTAFAGSRLPADVPSGAAGANVDWVRLPVAPTNPLNLVAQLAAIPAMAAARRVDVLHSPGGTGPIVAPGLATVLTLHDLIWLHHPEDWSASARSRFSTRVLSTRAARAATRIITGSQAACDDLVGTLGLEPGRIDVVPHAADGPRVTPLAERDLRERHDLGDRQIVLAVAQKRRYKRLDTCIRAIAALADLAPVLVLVGPPTPHEAELRSLTESLGVADAVRFLDWVADDMLEGLYEACACVVLPSEIEGFGLPVLEAMQRGAPVACSGRGALAEVAGDAALVFEPRDQRQVTGALRRLLTEADLRDRLRRAGRERAAAFSWQRTAKATVLAYERAAAARRR